MVLLRHERIFITANYAHIHTRTTSYSGAMRQRNFAWLFYFAKLTVTEVNRKGDAQELIQSNQSVVSVDSHSQKEMISQTD